MSARTPMCAAPQRFAVTGRPRTSGPISANFSPLRSDVTSRQLSGSRSFLNNSGVLSCLTRSSQATASFSFVVGFFDISATPFRSDIWAAHCDNQPPKAAATISARQQTASAIQIVVLSDWPGASCVGAKHHPKPKPKSRFVKYWRTK